MKTFCLQVSTLLLLGWCAAAVADDERSSTTDTCRKEVKRVIVWPHGSPKAPPMARVEEREVTVCDARVSKS